MSKDEVMFNFYVRFWSKENGYEELMENKVRRSWRKTICMIVVYDYIDNDLLVSINIHMKINSFQCALSVLYFIYHFVNFFSI